MIAPFEFHMSTRMVFGPGTSRQAGPEAKKLGASKVMLVADPGVEKAGLVGRVLESLQGAGLKVQIFNDVESNPRDVAVDRLADLVRQDGFDLLVGVGGGSAVDSAKGAAMVVTNGGSVRDYDGGGVTKPIHPVIAIPTTAGTGAEVSGNISITHTEKHYKMSVGRSPLCLPRLALLDPEMLYTLPVGIATAAGMDALSHALEGYLSPRASAFTDMMAIRAIEVTAASLEKFSANRADPGPASDMMFANALGGIVIAASSGGIGHAMARALGGRYDVHHGLACGILLAHHMRYNLPVREKKLAEVARAMGVPTEGLSQAQMAEKGIEAVGALHRKIGLPADFRNLKATEEDIQAMAKVALGNSGGNPRKATLEDIVALFREIL
jgi:alcohol dehydrogenase class IV